MRKLLALVALTAVVAACAEGGGATTTTSGDATTTSGPTTTVPAATTSSPAGSTTMGAEDGVHLADTGLGQILVDPDGMTLYMFTVDTGGESACYDSCADNWPAVPGDTAIASSLDSSMFSFGTTERTDGSSQLTLNGQPLYLFAGDSEPGDTNGQGLNDVWFVIDANGEMITEAPTGSLTSTTTPMDDYGY